MDLNRRMTPALQEMDAYIPVPGGFIAVVSTADTAFPGFYVEFVPAGAASMAYTQSICAVDMNVEALLDHAGETPWANVYLYDEHGNCDQRIKVPLKMKESREWT